MAFLPINPNGVPAGGWNYTESATGWNYPDRYNGSWGQLINAVLKHRQANPSLGLPTTTEAVERDVGNQIALRLTYEQRTQYFRQTDASAPAPNGAAQKKTLSPVARLVDRLRSDAKGGAILRDWLGEGGYPVDAETASARANICVSCPHNQPANSLERWVARTIHEHEEAKTGLSLRTGHDANLKSCNICGCWLPLKVWVPSRHLLAHSDPDDFPKHCWINLLKRESYWAAQKTDPIAKQNDWPAGFIAIPEYQGAIHFNPGLAVINGKLTMFSRRFVGGVSQVMAFPLSADMKAESRLPITVGGFAQSIEDPRLSWFGNRLVMSACAYESPTPGHQVVYTLNEALSVLGEHHVVYGRNGGGTRMNSGWEKNWTFFEHDNLNRFVYAMSRDSGHEVVTVNHDFKAMHVDKSPGVHWEYGEVRGGTPPIRYGDEYFGFFHSSMPWHGTMRYFMGAYAFEAKPPFKVTRQTMHPIAGGSPHDPWVGGSKPVIFPSGAHFDGQDWLVLYGVNDAICGWMKIPNQRLQELLGGSR